jgi:hypothetical protein
MLYFHNEDVARRARATIADVLKSFELELNSEKSRIYKLPEVTDDAWFGELARFRFSRRRTKTDLCEYFSIAFAHAEKYPNKQVMKAALSILRRTWFEKEAWPTYEALLLRTANADGSTLPIVSQILSASRNIDGRRLNEDAIKNTMSAVINHNARNGHSHEVAWALWIMRNMGVKLSESVAQAATNMNDAVCALLVLAAREDGLTRGRLDTSVWSDSLSQVQLFGQHWLLAYEANVRDWLWRDDKIDYVGEHPFFNLLKRNAVTFFDTSAQDDISDIPRARSLDDELERYDDHGDEDRVDYG